MTSRQPTPVCTECGNLVPGWRGPDPLCGPCFDRLVERGEIAIPESAVRAFERAHPELLRRKRPD